ncbi:MAG: hypothetical protein IPL61_07940 [Myxococcales bacterium]|nr:hypothetical protein [Myxococcales bacterium]
MCPHCRSAASPRPAGFTWWGGFIGARILNHVLCPTCGKGYNGGSGKPNTTGIIIYSVVVGGLALVAMALLLR